MNTHGRTFREAAVLALCAATVVQAFGFVQPARPQLSNFNKPAPPTAEIPPGKRAATAHLQARLPTARVDFDDTIASPKFVFASDGFLSGPNGAGRAVPASVAGGLADADPHRATKAFLQEH